MTRRAEAFGEGSATLKGVEIFAAGRHRDKEYTTADLDKMVENFNRYSSGAAPAFRVPAVIGHDEDQEYLEQSGLPAAGWAERVYRDNGKLKADFGNVPSQVTRLLRGKAYRTVSSEVYDEVPGGLPGAGTPGKMLRRVAFLGGEIPQVKSLSDIPAPEEHAEKGSFHAVLWKFAETRPFKFEENSAMDRDAMIQALTELGFSADAFPDTVPDPTLAEILRVCNDDSDGDEEPTDDMPDDKKKSLGEAYAAKAKKYRDMATRCGEKFDDGDDTSDMTAADTPIAAPASSMAVDDTQSIMTPPPVKPKPAAAAPAPSTAPKKVTHTMQYSEADFNKLVASVAAEVAKGLEPVKAKVDALDKYAEQRIASEKKATVKARLDTLVGQGKVLPAERDGGLDDVAYQLDAATVHKFSEGGKTVSSTTFDRFFKTLEARPALVKLGERVKGSANGKAAADADEAKLEEHYEQFSEQFEKNGLTKEKLLLGFKAEKARKPKLTAEEFLNV